MTAGLPLNLRAFRPVLDRRQAGQWASSPGRQMLEEPESQDLLKLMLLSRLQHAGQLRLRAAKLTDDIDLDHAEGLLPIPQVSLIPFRPFSQFDPTVPPCILR
jgi:hypothetical protein